MLQLPNGCSCSNPSVNPSNWKTGGSSLLEKDWFIQYWFRDPGQSPEWHAKHKYGKLIVVKGMNGYRTLADRRKATATLLKNELDMLRDGYNPIVKDTAEVKPVARPLDIDPTTPLIEALEIAMDKMKVGTKKDLRSVLKYTTIAAEEINYQNLPVNMVKRKHVKILLDHLGATKKIWTANTFNYYRAHLSMLFNELVEYEAIDYNPVWKISKMQKVQRIKETLSRDERHRVDQHLRKNKKTRFRLYMRLFFHSGIRSTEMLSLKGKDIDLKNQQMKVLVKKRRQQTEVMKSIKNISVRYWKLALAGCGDDDYIFSRNLKPGKKPINASHITKRWERLVKAPVEKGGLGITADFYSFKHGNTTEMIDLVGEHAAAGLNSHQGTAMVRRIYDTRRVDREHERIKAAGNEF